MTTTVPVPSVRPVPERALPRMVRLMARQSRRGLPPPRCAVKVAAGIEVPGADGVILRTDHYIPQLAGPLPALLVRSPYGRGFPWNFLYGALFAEQGFHVIVQSCRGTGGSTGRFEPFRHEQADGLATVAWLRQQDWFTGSLATIGASYLGYVQLALAADPPPELRAMIVQNCVTGPYPVMYPGGAFALENILIATAAMVNFERGLGAVIRAMLRLQRRLGRAARSLPLIDAYPPALGGRLGYFEEWLANPDPGSEYWGTLDVTADSPVPAVPVSLLTGWYDICLDGTLADYARLRAAGTPGPADRRAVDAHVRVQRRHAHRGGRGAPLAARAPGREPRPPNGTARPAARRRVRRMAGPGRLAAARDDAPALVRRSRRRP